MLLTGLKVVEYASYIAGPGAAGLLADWGAEVIKVERPGGDPFRRAFADVKAELPGNPAFDMDNRGKRAVVLDTSKPAGRDALAKLAVAADVFLTNVRPAALKRSGLDDETLRAINPRLVYAVVTGYGSEGPEAHKPGFDVASYWARAGVARLVAPKGVEPFQVRTGFGDHACALATASAVLAALYERHQTGVGRRIETSLLATGAYQTGSDLAVQLRLGRLASTRPRAQPFDALSNLYRSSDDRWLVITPKDGARDFPVLARLLDREDLLQDERFASGRARREHAAALSAEFDDAFGALPFAELARRLDQADFVWAPVQTAADLAADPQAAASGCFVEIDDGKGGTFRSPAPPVQIPGQPYGVRPASPAVGQHTREVLREAGYSDGEVEAMYAEGAAA